MYIIFFIKHFRILFEWIYIMPLFWKPYWSELRVRLDTVENWKLKLKIEKYCSKIIFKYVNSTVWPIFNKKVTKKWNLWVHKQYIITVCGRKVNIYSYCLLNSNRVLPKRVKKKKKKMQNADGWNAVSKLTLYLWWKLLMWQRLK